MYAVLSYYFLGYSFNELQTRMIGLFDYSFDKGLNYAIFSWSLEKLHTGLTDYWNFPIFYPARGLLAGSETYLGVALITLPFYLLSGKNLVFSHNMIFFLSNFLAASGMYFLCLKITRNTMAAFLAGILFAFSSFRITYISKPVYFSFQYLPWIFWALTLFFENRKWRYAVLMGGFTGLQALTCSTHGVYVISALVVAISFLIVSGRENIDLKFFVKILSAVIIAVIIIFPLYKGFYIQKNILLYNNNFSPSIKNTFQFYNDISSLFRNSGYLYFSTAKLSTKVGSNTLFPGWIILFLAVLYFSSSYIDFRKRSGAEWVDTIQRIIAFNSLFWGFVIGFIVFANFYPKHIQTDLLLRNFSIIKLSLLTVLWVILLTAVVYKMRKFLSFLNQNVKLYALLSCLFFLSALGPVAVFRGYQIALTPFWLFYYAFLPGYFYIRTTEKMVFIGFMALVIIASLGFTALQKMLERKHRSLKYIVLTFLVTPVLLLTLNNYGDFTPAETSRVLWLEKKFKMIIEKNSQPAEASIFSFLVKRRIKVFLANVFGETDQEILQVYQWLSNLNFKGCIVELPQKPGDELQGIYYFYHPIHWKPNLVGGSGFIPPSEWKTLSLLEEFPSSESIKVFRERNCKYIIFHRRYMSAEEWRDMKVQLHKFQEDLKLCKEFGSDIVYEVVYVRDFYPNYD